MKLTLSEPCRRCASGSPALGVFLCLNLALCLGLIGPAVVLAGESGSTSCLNGSPALPVEELRTISAQTHEMWPANLLPVDPTGMPLPEERDSTEYNGFQRPGLSNGLEFFNALDIVDGAGGTHLFMVYNAGWQIWDISEPFAATPQLLAQKDGWAGDFHEFEDTLTEFYFKLWDIAAVDPPAASGHTLVAVSGDPPVGPTIWDAADKLEPFQLHQDTAKVSHEVAAANIGGRSYSFQATTSGVDVYDMTRAREVGPCFEDTNSAVNLCGGNSNPVWRGRLEPWPYNRTRYVDVMETSISGQTRHFIASSDAFSNNHGVEIREITDVTSLPPTSVAVVEGLNTRVYGVSLFEIAGKYYLGAVNFDQFEIYDVTACIIGAAGCALTNPLFSKPTNLASFSYVQFSESNGRPFLHKGYQTLCSVPPATTDGDNEFLLDLGGLATGDPIVDVRGEEYVDPNHTNPPRRIDYWSSYYDGATGGYSAFAPHKGKFHGRYFYRAAQTMFDVHEWTGDLPPEAEIQATSSERFLSSPAQNEWVSLGGECTFGADSGWSWSAANDAGEPPADPAPVLEFLGGSLARMRSDLCDGDTYPAAICPGRTVVTEAEASCDALPLTSNQLALTLLDPRPFFDSLGIAETPSEPGPPAAFPVCQTLTFEAISGAVNEISGKALTSYTWEVTPAGRGAEEALTCTAASADTGLSCTGSTLAWSTEGIDAGISSFLFSDGFESGNSSRWSSNQRSGSPGRGAVGVASAANGFATKGVSPGVTFDVTLTAGNEHGAIDRTTQVTLTPLEALVFTGAGFTIPGTPPADGLYDFSATAENATSYRWEIEQDSALPGDAGCLYVTPCEVRTATSPELQYVWPFENVNGADYEVWLEISNCDVSVPALATLRTVQNVAVIEPDPPTITDFRVVEEGGCNCVAIGGGGCACPTGNAEFTLAYDGTCNDLTITWGDGDVSSGLSCNAATYTHNFTSSGVYTLQAEACYAGDCDTQVNLTNLGSPVTLQIQ